MKKQKEIFLKNEGDAWFKRNKKSLYQKKDDLIINTILKLNLKPKKILEIGCSNGWRLQKLHDLINSKVYGIDPSREAIKDGYKQFQDVQFKNGVADCLEFENNFFDMVIFGFCLYVCDLSDLFKIAYETNRVLKQNSNIIIYDFFNSSYYSKVYGHYEIIQYHIMDFSKMFLWHPEYTTKYMYCPTKNDNNFIAIIIINLCYNINQILFTGEINEKNN